MTFATSLRCVECSATYSLEDRRAVCNCGGLLDVKYDYEQIQHRLDKKSLSTGTHSMWRYEELLPVSHAERIVSLGEGLTPLRSSSKYGESLRTKNLHFKLDFLNPTGSFKDRGSSVTVSKLRELAVNSAMDDSSGNAGASLAAYCAKAGIQCTLYVPDSAPLEKIVQAEIYGASIVRVTGSRTDVAKAAENAWKTSSVFYASHNSNAFFVEGMKTVAFEIVEDMSWKVPDNVVFPVGGGTLLVGAWKGFEELIRLGWIDRMPRLHCVQSEACMPIVEAFRNGASTIAPAVERGTIAGGIRIAEPARGLQVLEALSRTRGHAVEVTDNSILRHQVLLARKEGIFAEPTSCAALAGLERLRKTNIIEDDESVVVELTGIGLKDAKTALMALGAQHTG